MIASDSEQNASLLTSFFNYIGTLISGFFSSIWQFFAGGNNTESNEQPVTPPLPGNVTNGQSGAEENKNSTDASWAGKSGIFENKIASGDNPDGQFGQISDKTENSHTNSEELTRSVQIIATVNDIITIEEENKNSTDASLALQSGIFENEIASGDNPDGQFGQISDKTENSHTNSEELTRSVQMLATVNDIITIEEENKNSTDASWAGKSGIFENKIASGDNPKKLKVNITPKTNQSNLLNCFFSNNYGNSNTIQDNQSDSQSVASETSNDSSVISNILTYLRF